MNGIELEGLIILSKEQEESKKLKILVVTKMFLKTGGSIAEIAKETGIPSSTVQRYLHGEEIVRMLGQESYDIIQNKIADNKKKAVIKGGKNYAMHNEFVKDELGKFIGSRKK